MVEKKVVKRKCKKCEGLGIINIKEKSLKDKVIVEGKYCKQCGGTGTFEDYTYLHYYKGKDGKKYCIDGETLK